jgi:hypothetical protein
VKTFRLRCEFLEARENPSTINGDEGVDFYIPPADPIDVTPTPNPVPVPQDPVSPKGPVEPLPVPGSGPW